MSNWYNIPERPLEPPEDRIFGYCDKCSGEIYEGNEFYRIDGQVICKDCLEDFAAGYFSDCYDAEEEVYYIDNAVIESADLERFAESYFAGEREEAEITVRYRGWW